MNSPWRTRGKKNSLKTDSINSFYNVIQSQIGMHGKFVDFYSKYYKSHTYYDFYLVGSVKFTLTVHRN